MKHFLIFLLSGLLISSNLNAQTVKEEAKAFGKEKAKIANDKATSTATKYQIPGYSDSYPDQTKYMKNPDTLNDDGNTAKGSNPAAQFYENNQKVRPKIPDGELDSWMQKSFSIQDNPQAHASGYSGEYGSCEEVEIGGPSDVVYFKTCEEGHTATVFDSFCEIPWIVEANSEFKYSCNREETFSYEEKCNEWLTVRCTGRQACSKLNSIVSITAPFNRTTGYGSVGRAGDNYHKGNCTFFNRTYSVTISDVNLIDSFVITRVVYDDWVNLTVNGQFAFQVPYGNVLVTSGNKVRVNSGGGYQNCEKKDQIRYVNVDIKPYLKNGTNTLYFKHLVKGKGDFYADFKITGSCCSNYEDEIQNNCGTLP